MRSPPLNGASSDSGAAGTPGTSSGRQERVTATGWRLVGRAVSLIDEFATTELVPAGRDEDLLFAGRFRARPRLGNGSAVAPILTVLSGALARVWPDAPPLTMERPLSQPPGRFHGVRWEPAGADGAWNATLLWRHRHPVVAGAPCTTHVLLSEQERQVLLDVRVSADAGLASVRGMVGAGQARPAFLGEAHRSVRLRFGGADGDPRQLRAEEVDNFVPEVLLSEAREYPVAVLAPLEDGEYVLPPETLADELLGLAHLYVIDRHQATFRLTDALGDRRLSCYWGALRVYLPEFSCADRPEDHPLLVRERLLDPVIRADLVGKLARRLAAVVPRPVAPASSGSYAEATQRANPSPRSAEPTLAVRETDFPVTPTAGEKLVGDLSRELAHVIASIPTSLTDVHSRLGAIASDVAALLATQSALRAEVERLRTTNAVRALSVTSLERRMKSLEDLIRQHVAPVGLQPVPVLPSAAEATPNVGDEEESESASLVEVLRQAAVAHSDVLLILDEAERAAKDSPYEDTERLAVILDAMATVARRRQEGALGTSLKESFRELGIDYRGGITPNTSARQLQQYVVRGAAGEVYDCREHIALGNSYDPRFCLRIYFTSRAPLEPRFVVGHVGRHFEVSTTT